MSRFGTVLFLLVAAVGCTKPSIVTLSQAMATCPGATCSAVRIGCIVNACIGTCGASPCNSGCVANCGKMQRDFLEKLMADCPATKADCVPPGTCTDPATDKWAKCVVNFCFSSCDSKDTCCELILPMCSISDANAEFDFLRKCGGGSGGCTAPQTSCGGTCVNTQTDILNCGLCGKKCDAGQGCTNGVCGAGGQTCVTSDTCPQVGNTLCCPAASSGQICINPQTDSNNCSKCGHHCDAGVSCVAGTCSGQCPGATPDSCPGGVCVNFKTDASHCGNCSTTCTGVQHCLNGACSACPTAQDPECPTACKDSDPLNCGDCGNACPAAKPHCTAGECHA